MDHAEAARFLFDRTAGKKKWSLGPTRALLGSIGNPELRFPSIHVGGTNGKGSVATMIYSVLRRMGLKTALYTSPHLVDLRERMIVNGSPIPRDAFPMWVELLHDKIIDCDASFFEATTAIAFADFAARGCDIAVIEVGLGGRLDATNILNPLASVVTNVSLEHTDYLGPSLEDIAFEKAGIAKRGRPFVIGEQDVGVARLLRDKAAGLGADVHCVPGEETYTGPMTMLGAHQRRNAAVAESVLNRLPARFRPDRSQIRQGIKDAFVPGRFDCRGKWIFDVAHNPAGIDVLLSQLREVDFVRPLHVLVGILEDKDWLAILRALSEVTDAGWLTVAPSMPTDRLPDVANMANHSGGGFLAEPDFDVALNAVQTGAGTVLVTGSFHTVGDTLARLPGFAPLG